MTKKEPITFEQYLIKMGMTNETVKTYTYQVGFFLNGHEKADVYNYQDILIALEELGKYKSNVNYKTSILASMKQYYDYLIHIGKRNDHPCRTIYLRKSRDRSLNHQDFFSSSELELLMNREERYQDLKVKNQVLISLLIYQGLAAGEIARMKLTHVNLDEGNVFVKESADNTRRHLDLVPKQYSIFHRYINDTRKKLLRDPTESLIVGKLGKPVTTGEVGYLVEQFKPMFPDRNLNPSTIRQSVISNWINEKRLPLETVQLMAGHKWLSTTARYKQTDADEKRILINRFHPLK